jgi:hypothetical protein
MWALWLLTGISSVGAVVGLSRLVAADAGAQERPVSNQLGPTFTVAWAASAIGWAVLVVHALTNERFWAALALTGAAALILVGPVAARSAAWSLRRLLESARRNEADRVYSATGLAVHEAQNLLDAIGPQSRSRVEQLSSALKNLAEAASRARRSETYQSLVQVERRRRGDTAPAYNNWTDQVRLWHTAGIEWLALLATLILRAGLVASAVALPASLTAGVEPSPGDSVAAALPWLALAGWSAALALFAPAVASVAMDRSPPTIRLALVVEAGLLLLALAFTPSWAVAVSLAGWWNCANRLPAGFSWTTQVPTAGGLTATVLVVSILVHGGEIAGALVELVVAGVLAAAISNSYAVFWPATLFAFVVVPLTERRSRRSAQRKLRRQLDNVHAELAQLESAAMGLDTNEQTLIRSSVALMDAWLRGRTPEMADTLGDSVDLLVRERLGTRSRLVYDGVDGTPEVLARCWRAPHERRTQLFGLLVMQLAAEAARHGADLFEVEIHDDGKGFVVCARNRRRSDQRPVPRGGMAIAAALAAALDQGNVTPPGPDPHDPQVWLMRFRVPSSLTTLP